MAINLYVDGKHYVSISCLASMGLIENPKEFFKALPDNKKIKLVEPNAYKAFVEFAVATGCSIREYIVSKADKRVSSFRTKEPIGFIAKEIVSSKLTLKGNFKK